MRRARTAASRAAEIAWKDRGEVNSFPWSWVVNGVVASFFFPHRIRVQLYRLLGLRGIHRRAIIRPGVIIRSTRFDVGASTLIGYRALFDVRTRVSIGRNVAIGAYVCFVDTDHDISDPSRRAGVSISAPIVVGDGARISTGSIVLPGVTIGEGAVVGAGSLVRDDCEPHALYVGRPARKVRDLPR